MESSFNDSFYFAETKMQFKLSSAAKKIVNPLEYDVFDITPPVIINLN